MSIDNYKKILHHQDDGSWVADIPCLPACFALMTTREAALAELSGIFQMVADEYRERGEQLPADTTEFVSS